MPSSVPRVASRVYSTALVSTAVFACVVFGSLGVSSVLDPRSTGGISCEYCRNHLAEYYPHAAGELVHDDAEFVASMKTHLEKCTFCRGKFNAMYPELSTASLSTRPTLALAMQPMLVVGPRSALY